MSIQKQFAKFHDAIKLTREDGRYKEAREKDDSIKSDIKAAFKDAGYPVVEDFIQGSMADGVNTGIVSIHGDRDIDRAIVIDLEKAPDDPIAPKKLLRDTLKNRGFSNPKIKKPCVTADYVGNDLHFDYPIYRRDGSENLELAVGKEFSSDVAKKWDSNDTKALLDHLKDKNGNLTPLEKDQRRRITRYLKRWRDVRYSNAAERSKVYSIGLTLMANGSFSKQVSEDGVANDLLALRETLNTILNFRNYFILTDYEKQNYDIKVNLPVRPWRDVFDSHGTSVGTPLRKKLANLLKKCDEAIAEEDVVKQAEILRKQFGDDFPIPEKSESAKKNIYIGSGIVADHGGA
jgi:hypothetical protein